MTEIYLHIVARIADYMATHLIHNLESGNVTDALPRTLAHLRRACMHD